MHFQHPELLYALLLLIIPLIVHLFRLRRFQKEDFTNVKFLKKVIQETRKSSRLKKFLILLTRLFLIACLVLAFAQPFIPASEQALQKSETFIYLDNSFSMQAQQNGASLLQNAVNELLESLDESEEYSLITNDREYLNRTTADLKKQLQEIEFSDMQLDLQSIKLKADNHFADKKSVEKNFVLISDFQALIDTGSDLNMNQYRLSLIPSRVEEIANISIDSAFIQNSNPENFDLQILFNKEGELKQPVSISIFNNTDLLGRTTIQEFNDNEATASFRLQNEVIENGKIEIEDSGLKYDNELYFNISENEAVRVVVISDNESEFLNRIYSEPEFELNNYSSSQIDFNQLNSANLIIVNEIEQLTASLQNNLKNSKDDGASLVIIPANNAINYNSFLSSVGLPPLNEKINSERLITKIVYDHPLFQGVFENRTENFEYPKSRTSYNISSGNTILSYQDGNAFLTGSDRSYLFSAALNSENSNFQNSPLIVPVFYQIGLNASRKNDLYYTTGTSNTINIPVELGKDQVLHLVTDNFDVIPQQQNYSNRVEINTDNIALEAGNYEVTNASTGIGNVSFNYDREESELNYMNLSDIENATIYDTVNNFFSESNAASQITALWKWFVIFALIFFAIEMLLIKFLK